MSAKLPAALAATALLLAALRLPAQQPAAQPIQSMPYSPSLDVTSLDRSVDPCVDFYKFSCGGWQKNNPIPADQSGWSVYAKLGNENAQFLWGILEADAKAKDRTVVGLAVTGCCRSPLSSVTRLSTYRSSSVRWIRPSLL